MTITGCFCSTLIFFSQPLQNSRYLGFENSWQILASLEKVILKPEKSNSPYSNKEIIGLRGSFGFNFGGCLGIWRGYLKGKKS